MNKKCLALKKKAVYIEQKKKKKNFNFNLCLDILKKENIKLDTKEITKIIKASKFDIRQIIINLELNCRSRNIPESLDNKNKKSQIFEKDFVMEEYKLTEMYLTNYKSINNVMIYSNINKVICFFMKILVNI